MTAGIYQILNRITADCFIGGSTEIELMLDYYAKVLSSVDISVDSTNNRELSFNSKLRQDWFKYGRESFSLKILEKTKRGKTNVSTRLRFWCRLLQPTYNEYRYLPIVSGVYQILNIRDGSSYIGQSKDIYQRWMHHKNALRGDKHHNRHLQLSFNQWGESNFELNIIKLYEPDLKPLAELEKQWINCTDNLFNIVV